MASKRWRTYLAALLLAAAMVTLVTLLLRPGLSPYLAVDELAARASEFRNTEIRLAGYLASATIVDAAGKTTFVIAARDARFPVILSDRLPPGLRTGAEILLDGRLGDDGMFHAHRLLTQCSSRYSEKLGARPAESIPPEAAVR